MTSGISAYGYEGKRAFVVGGASGIGAATAKLLTELGAEVIVADFAEVPFECAKKIQLDLRDQASIAAALEACGGPIHALFSCAGIFTGPEVLQVNCVGQRELIERAIGQGLLPRGSAVAMIASNAGLGYEQNMSAVREFLDTPDYEAAQQWVAAHPEQNNYAVSKQIVIVYCAMRAFDFITKGIRINALCPTSTDTPLARRSFGWLEYGTDFRETTGVRVADPMQQAYPLAFLCSAAADYISGTLLSVDSGLHGARWTGTFVPQPPVPPSTPA